MELLLLVHLMEDSRLSFFNFQLIEGSFRRPFFMRIQTGCNSYCKSSGFCLCRFTSECSSDTSRCTKKQINCQEIQYPIIISKI